MNSTIKKFTEEELRLCNKHFENELADTIEQDYQFDNGYEYFDSVLLELHREQLVNYKIAPPVNRELTWYEDCEGDLWYHEIPANCTIDGTPSVVNCMPLFRPYYRESEVRGKTIEDLYDV